MIAGTITVLTSLIASRFGKWLLGTAGVVGVVGLAGDEAGAAIFAIAKSILLNTLNYSSNLLPFSDGLPQMVFDNIPKFTQMFGLVNQYLPVDTVFIMLAIMIKLQFVMFGVMVVMKITYFVRGIDGDVSRYLLFGSLPDHTTYTTVTTHDRITGNFTQKGIARTETNRKPKSKRLFHR